MAIFFLAASLFLRIAVNSANKNTINSNARPYYLMFFSPYCGHCKKVHPTWENLTVLHENDTQVTIGEVDCSVFGNICVEYSVTAYPTFITIIHGNRTKIDVPRNIESYEAKVAEIKATFQSMKCSFFDGSNSSFPAFVYCPKPSENPCETVQKIVNATGFSDIYAGNCESPQLSVFLSPSLSIPMKAEFSVDGAAAFVREFSALPFSPITFEALQRISRPSIIVLCSGLKCILPYRTLAYETFDRYYWVQIPPKQVLNVIQKHSFGEHTEFIVTDSAKKNWEIFSDLGEGKEIREVIKGFGDGKLSLKHNQSLEGIFIAKPVSHGSAYRVASLAFITILGGSLCFVCYRSIKAKQRKIE